MLKEIKVSLIIELLDMRIDQLKERAQRYEQSSNKNKQIYAILIKKLSIEELKSFKKTVEEMKP